MTTKERRMLQCMSFLFFPLLVVGAYTACKVYDEYLDGYYYNITELGVAAVKNNDDAIDNLVNSGCDVNYNGTGVTWMNLKYVYQQGEEEYTYEEYSHGDEYHGEDFSILNGETALHIAVNHASIEVVKKLVEIPGVNIDAKSGRGETALHDAASFGLSEIIKILVSAGADLETENKDGYTPLQSAAMYGQVDGVKTLALLEEDLLVSNRPNLVSIVPAQLLSRSHEGGGVEGNPRKPEVMSVHKNILNKDIGVAAVVQVPPNIPNCLCIHDVGLLSFTKQLPCRHNLEGGFLLLPRTSHPL